MRYNKFKKAYLIYNETTDSMAILFQEQEDSKTATLKVLDKSFKEEYFQTTCLKRLVKDHHWLYLGEL